MKSYGKFYLTTLGILLVLSAYPIIMGGKIVILQLQKGSIRTEDYARYVIPYTAICLSIIFTAAVNPLIAKLKAGSGTIATILALGIFVIVELLMEKITITGTKVQSTVDWQLFSCVGTPQAVKAFQKPYSSAFRIHYFLVAFVIIAIIVNIVYGYGNLVKNRNSSGKLALRLQLIAAALLLGLCVYANITGFFRNTNEYLSPLSGTLTATFFIVLGGAFGIYVGSFLMGKGRIISLTLPAAASMLVCTVMYYGEFKLLDGSLYRFGRTAFFKGLPAIVLSPADILIIIASGAVSALIMELAQRKNIIAIKKSEDSMLN